MAHPVMWFEVLGSDGGKLQQFYGDLFGWTFDVIQPIKVDASR
jgi:predicted enzyme related to lactoylglutathione lyase